ncbi:MAG: DUF2508 family protein [Peptococcaceae bacterium]
MNHLLEKLLRFKEALLSSEILNEDVKKAPSLVEMVEAAKEEWLDAKKFFEEVTDPVLIDHAIYRMESAEKRYIYLLKTADEEKVINDHVQLN